MYGVGIIKGMAMTLRHLLRRPFTVQYPEERLPLADRFRGNALIWLVQKCTGCNTCAKSCPHGVIEVVTSAQIDENRYQVDKFEVDTGLCIFCGLCVEACPFDALYMSKEFERSKYQRGELVWGRDDLIATDKKPSAYAHPYLLTGPPPPKREGW